MAKVHPDVVAADPADPLPSPAPGVAKPPPPTVLTVWRKSLLFNCDGFTVFDAKGDLAFRVDSYGGASSRGRRRARRGRRVLMDVAGKPLLTVRRKRRLGSLLGEQHWVIYDGDAAEGEYSRPLLSVRRRRHVGLRAVRSSR
jgi:uncharacterized protein YxjI